MNLRNLAARFNDVSAGTAVDIVLRKLTLMSWRARTSISVTCNKQKAKLQVRKGSTDAEVVWQCFPARQYEIPVVMGARPLHRNAVQAKYLEILKSGKKPLIVDCGANIGASSAWFKMTYPASTVVAIEPAPDNFAALRANCSQFSEVDAFEAGIGPNDATAFLQDGGGGAWGYQTSDKETSVKINMISLRTILNAKKTDNYVPFILKIDIEGAEKDLFDRDSCESIGCFPVLIFESHDFYMPAQRTSSPFFRFHADTGRDFLFGLENIFSIDMKAMTK